MRVFLVGEALCHNGGGNDTDDCVPSNPHETKKEIIRTDNLFASC